MLGFLAERRAGQDREVEDLHFGVEAAGVDVVEAAADGIDRVAGQADDQIDFHLDSQIEHRPGAALEGPEVVVAVHQFHRQRIDRLQADFDFGESRRRAAAGRRPA